MSVADLRSKLPEYAKDLKLNLDSVLSEAGAPGLNLAQISMVALGAAFSARYKPLTEAIAAFAAEHATAEQLTAAKGSAAIMGMNNIYYRFQHLVSHPEYASIPAKLRMNVIGAYKGDAKNDFELVSLAVSAVNGCGMCIDSHDKVLRDGGISVQAIQSAVRIASVIHGVAVVLEQADAAG
ncbi:alkyl hydroperoxide reductase subunit D [Luteibacter sp. OK325]|jgi:lipoyl-dependent peroxiredoxin subunit D|uniref:carboxymuconolactone decarboxylase family protein n=1 Tax=Luteibacter sp. OK325 TaxID=2135670 RepID=UPI000D352BC4|nr:carboxymuconolactone decarboxylase family protein [Luteibacter sp. OK325]PTR34758.1 alkyl hydroperoxide reductase subunit D [Luteibacter sp. OK325]